MSSYREERIKIIGFNDFWFIIIGSIILSFITDFLFNGFSFLKHSFILALVNLCISFLFAICNWMIMRKLMIVFRKKYPDFKDNFKRVALLFTLIVATILMVDRIGANVFGLIIGENYHHPKSAQLLVPIILISVMILAIYEAIYFYTRLKTSVREEEQAKQVVIEAQLDALRNQARPHFLFNSLNTLRDIIENDDKSNAIQFVDELSDVYRYILESGNVNLITLEDEIKFAKSYIHIQSERFGNNLQIEWNIDTNLLVKKIIPMSLQLLLENAIKHNIISKSNPLKINVTIENNSLIVENNIQAKSTQLPSTKIGLESIQKRYKLISKESAIINNNGKTFQVIIPLLKQQESR